MRNAHRSLRVAFIHVSKCICIIKIGLDAHFHGCAGPLHCWSPMTVPKAFFARKIDFGAKLSREETQERATDVGPVMNKEKKRERERKRERQGSGRIKGQKFLHSCRDLVLVHADDPNTH